MNEIYEGMELTLEERIADAAVELADKTGRPIDEVWRAMELLASGARVTTE